MNAIRDCDLITAYIAAHETRKGQNMYETPWDAEDEYEAREAEEEAREMYESMEAEAAEEREIFGY